VEVDASAELLMITHEYEEYKPARWIWAWLAVILLAILTGTWGMITHMAVPDVARHWDFDVLPDTPGSSPYAALPPPNVAPIPPQIDLPVATISDLKSPISNSPPPGEG
jgi:hypothetical protein